VTEEDDMTAEQLVRILREQSDEDGTKNTAGDRAIAEWRTEAAFTGDTELVADIDRFGTDALAAEWDRQRDLYVIKDEYLRYYDEQANTWRCYCDLATIFTGDSLPLEIEMLDGKTAVLVDAQTPGDICYVVESDDCDYDDEIVARAEVL
jgi:hypothetical protein